MPVRSSPDCPGVYQTWPCFWEPPSLARGGTQGQGGQGPPPRPRSGGRAGSASSFPSRPKTLCRGVAPAPAVGSRGDLGTCPGPHLPSQRSSLTGLQGPLRRPARSTPECPSRTFLGSRPPASSPASSSAIARQGPAGWQRAGAWHGRLLQGVWRHLRPQPTSRPEKRRRAVRGPHLRAERDPW